MGASTLILFFRPVFLCPFQVASKIPFSRSEIGGTFLERSQGVGVLIMHALSSLAQTEQWLKSATIGRRRHYTCQATNEGSHTDND